MTLISETQDANLLFCPSRSIELKDNTVIVVLGASGDLAKKKTVSTWEKDLNSPLLTYIFVVPSSFWSCTSTCACFLTLIH